jgi:hemolysin activation/secretion protein
MVILVQAMFLVAGALPAGAQSANVVPSGGSPAAVADSFKERKIAKPTELPEIVIQEESGGTLKGGKGVTFTLKKVRFEGNDIFSSEELQEELWDYLNAVVEVSALQKLADKITRFYKDKGYFLTRAYLPPQSIKGGELLIKVREGRLGEIIIRGNKRYSRDLIRNTLKIIRGEGAVRTADVERALLLLTDIPGLTVKATFKPGAKPATSDIVLDVTEDRPVKAGLDFDNFGSEFVSRERYGITASTGNLTGMGDSFSVRGVTGNDFLTGLFYGQAEWIQPLNYHGTRLGVYYQHMAYELGQELKRLDFTSRTNAGGLYVSHPLLRGRYVNWSVQGGMDMKNLDNSIFNQSIGEDKLRIAHVGTTFQWVDVLGGANTIRLKGHQNLGNVLGGMPDDFKDTVRQPCDIVYSKLDFDASRIQDIFGHANLILAGAGQWTNDRLPSSEMISIGGASTVRGYDQGEFSGDAGYYLTTEAQVPFPGGENLRWYSEGKTLSETLAFAAFWDYGWVGVNDKLQSERAVDAKHIGGVGLGLRFNYNPFVRLRFDWAKAVSGNEPRDKSVEDNGMWYLQCVMAY